MGLQFEAVMNIKATDLKEIITEYVQKDGKLKVVSIDFNISTHTLGYGPGEHDVSTFEGAKVKVQPAMSEFD